MSGAENKHDAAQVEFELYSQTKEASIEGGFGVTWKTNDGTKTDNKIQGDGVKAIAEVLETNTTLTALGLRGEQQQNTNDSKPAMTSTMSKQKPRLEEELRTCINSWRASLDRVCSTNPQTTTKQFM